jgi:DNA-binding transcriptional LysR family regulator
MNDLLFPFKLFVRVARTGSFSQAARELGLTQSTASRIITSLEQNLGARLLARTTRAVVLTEAGADYLVRIEPILAKFEEANVALHGSAELRGILRVGLPSSIAIREIIPRLKLFMQAHPALRIDLIMDDHRQDLLKDGLDLALRFGPLPDSTDIARYVGSNRRILVASPDYIARSGALNTPTDLALHTIIIGPPGNTPNGWAFEKNNRKLSIQVEGKLLVNVNEAATAAALNGMGIISTGIWGCRAELESGALVRILADWTMAESKLYAIFPAGAAKPSARALTAYLITEFEKATAA